MKATGIVRRLDELGRIVIPMEIRKVNKWYEGTPLELFANEDGLMLRRYNPIDEDTLQRMANSLAEFQALLPGDSVAAPFLNRAHADLLAAANQLKVR